MPPTLAPPRSVRLLAVLLVAAACAGPAADRASGSAYPGRNGLVAFERDGKLYVATEDGRTLRRVNLPSGLLIRDVQVSPNGKSFVFVTTGFSRQFPHQVATATLQGSRLVLRSLTLPYKREYNSLRSPTWSPNGKQVAFACVLSPTRARGFRSRQEICAVGADARGFRQVTRCNCILLQANPTWSSRNVIAFYRLLNIWTVSPNGSNMRRLTDRQNGPTGNDGFHDNPAWSPNGQLLAYNTAEGNIQVVSASGGPSRRIVQSSFSGAVHTFYEPTWAPSGNAIAFRVNALQGSSSPFTYGIYTMRFSDGAFTRLSSNRNDKFPDWGPLPR